MQVSPLIEAEELYQELHNSEISLIDTREDRAYAAGHIPGAVQIHDIFTYIALPENGSLAALFQHFKQLMENVGIDPKAKIVIYEDTTDNGYGQSCRGWMILQYLGYEHVRVLHGGYRAWLTRNFQISQDVPARNPATLRITPLQGVFVSSQDVLKTIGQTDVVLLDCRDYAEWIGANSSPYGYDYCPRKGRIPGATWLEWYRFMRHEKGVSWFESPQAVRNLCEQAGIPDYKPIFVYCFKGARASAVVLALKRAGYQDVRNYFSSWNEWSRNLDLPIDEGYPD
ncbi:MAG: sulfurtransferase [Chloroflexi bacterium HGW-Chloroflexi-10]|nr:MAG: sulfurtransferase [Chloroflexi bacterium HGW-Chloroflexi-10]